MKDKKTSTHIRLNVERWSYFFRFSLMNRLIMSTKINEKAPIKNGFKNNSNE